MKTLFPANQIKTLVSGFFMGTAEVIPGISGSTVALLLRIYSKFVDLLYSVSVIPKAFLRTLFGKSQKAELKQSILGVDYRFALPLIIGMLLAIGTMSSVVIIVFERFPHLLYAFLLGLVVSVLVIPLKVMEKRTYVELLVFLVSFATLFFLLGQRSTAVISDPGYLLLFIGGMYRIDRGLYRL